MKKKDIPQTNMLCAYCNAPRDGEMVSKYITSTLHSGWYDEPMFDEVEAEISIHCTSCETLLYKKPIVITE